MSSTTFITTTTLPPPALTTLFTPASSCLVDIWQYAATKSDLQCYVDNTQVQCNYVQLGPSTTSDCFPTGWNYDRSAFFSPGICPLGYVSACSSLATVEGTIAETRVTCCPSGYSCQTDSTAWPWYTTDQCTYTNPGPVTYVYTTSMPGAGVVTTTATKNEGFNAYGVQVRFRESDSISDLMATATAAASISSQEASTSSPTVTSSSSLLSTFSTASAAASSDSKSRTTGLSTAAEAGIGVGVAIGLIIVIAATLFFLRRRRQLKQQELSARKFEDFVKPELDGTPYSELQSNAVVRLVELE